ncbi:hypothetical protein RRF57_011240 [Xylaria bambusicola]|uniref:Uncharacterized protein n=1 Tax=Xylaria bambusicola TaxID=326684 RepID=A0AAN7ZE01_9PEZI
MHTTFSLHIYTHESTTTTTTTIIIIIPHCTKTFFRPLFPFFPFPAPSSPSPPSAAPEAVSALAPQLNPVSLAVPRSLLTPLPVPYPKMVVVGLGAAGKAGKASTPPAPPAPPVWAPPLVL